MAFQLSFFPYRLGFRFDARTSRGAMQHHQVFYLKLWNTTQQGINGIGECAPLPGLSPDHRLAEATLQQFAAAFNQRQHQSVEEVEQHCAEVLASDCPALRFALETALLDYRSEGSKIIFPTPFAAGQKSLPINGLIWMGDKSWMLQQVRQKVEQGFNCLKLKIGSLQFEEELNLIGKLRQEFSGHDLTIRLDANGAFAPAEALQKLDQLSRFHIHSIEQPIRAGQWEPMAKLCSASPVPIALDEELIGPQDTGHKQQLLDTIKPHFIILKPTLVGGLRSCSGWIALAEERQVAWWITSALESNIGLNAIAQYTATFPVTLPQGLGTGQLYHNNIGSPLTVGEGSLFYDPFRQWQLPSFLSA